MEVTRGRFQGVGNIVRFNWPFYIFSLITIVTLLVSENFLAVPYQYIVRILCVIAVISTLLSLLVSMYVYDFSGLYRLQWLDKNCMGTPSDIVNIHSGFDEFSDCIGKKYINARLTVFDFYDAEKHTEPSIKRARSRYPSHTGTINVTTAQFSSPDNSADLIFVLLSAHEIRNADERVVFFKEVKRILRDKGQIVVTEHLRNTANFIAYNFGYLHFYSKSSWMTTFHKSGLFVSNVICNTPFITTFIITKNGITS